MGNSIKKAIQASSFSRRSFLAGSAGGSLVLAFGLPGVVQSATAAIADRQFSPAVWFEMDATGAVKVNVAKAEMGQHVGTALARIVADELGADWGKVTIDHVDTDPKWGYMVTGGSWSVVTSFTAMSQAGAAGRMVLCEAGAKLLGVDAADCTASNGMVKSGSQSISFAEIVQKGDIDRQFTADELSALPIKNPQNRDLIGKPSLALDVPEKTRGTAVYGIDVERPGMLYGRPLLPPTRYGSSVNAVDDSAAQDIKGYAGFEVLEDPSNTLQGWVVALADNYWSAVKAADALKVDWTPGDTASVSESDIQARGEAIAREQTGPVFVAHGDITTAATAADKTLESTYRTSTALHFTLEPGNAVAEQVDGTWHIWTGNQWQSLIQPLLAAALGVEDNQVVIHQHYLGGGYGRRLFGDYILPAALTSKATGKPVKVVFTREDDSRFDCARSPSVQHFHGYFAAGKLTGMHHHAVAGWPTQAMAPPFMLDGQNDSGKIDPFAANGSDHWYNIPHHRVLCSNNPLAQKTFLPGWLRAVGPGWMGWGVESFVDEMAYEAGADPLDFRLQMLDAQGHNAGEAPNSVGGAKRLHAALTRVKELSGWGQELPKDEGMGVAVCGGQERDKPTWVACVVHVKVDRDSGRVQLKKLWQVIDCGTVVHPDGALAQAEGASLWGVSLALHEGTQFMDGQVADRNLDSYSPLRMADMPEQVFEFVDNTEFPMGMGEPPLIPVPPAIGNAIFAAAGVRMRDIPIRPGAVKAALQA